MGSALISVACSDAHISQRAQGEKELAAVSYVREWIARALNYSIQSSTYPSGSTREMPVLKSTNSDQRSATAFAFPDTVMP